MKNLDIVSLLTRPAPPWIITTDISHKEIKKGLSINKVYENLFILNADKMRSYKGLYKEFYEVLKFPDYFGWNLNALDECLSDMEWLNLDSCVLFIENIKFLLSDEKQGEKECFLKILERICEEYSKPIEDGEEWDRLPVPFHIVIDKSKMLRWVS